MHPARRNLVLTGASRGIGHATVKRFAEAGWNVFTISRHPFAPDCPWEGGKDQHVVMDLADSEAVEQGIAALRELLAGRPLHALVNNAAISPKAEDGGRLSCVNTSMTLWHQVFQVNFFGPILLARGLLSSLQAAPGAIVNVTSIVGGRVHPFAGTAYATSKAALAALTREMAAELGPLGIRVNAIAPGEISTDMISPETTERLVPEIPMGRMGTPAEVAEVIYMLCTERASYINGAEIHINGGQHC